MTSAVPDNPSFLNSLPSAMPGKGTAMSQTKHDSAGDSDSRPGMRGEDNPYQEKKEATNQEKVRSLASKVLSLRFVQTGARGLGR